MLSTVTCNKVVVVDSNGYDRWTSEKILGLYFFFTAPERDHRITPGRSGYDRDHGNGWRKIALLPAARPVPRWPDHRHISPDIAHERPG